MGSKHLRVRSLPGDLFNGVTRFTDLEERIATLPTELARGDAFEVFVEAFLATNPVWQVAELWLVGQVPLDVRRTLNLPADAKGIDGVFGTRSGRLVPYQVKFRIGRPKIGVADVATFLGLTDRAEDRVLISNANRYAGDVEIRDHLRLLRGTDFDALTVDNWAAITDWADSRPVIRTKATPREDQQQALASIAETFVSHDRATVVMPCGTGKTLVQLWAAEEQRPRSVLVLVPSLALLSQTLDEWGHNTNWGNRFEYLCVCSDPSVSAEQDALQLRSTDVPFRVDTDPDVVRQFLNRPQGDAVRVVFSTYQSAPVVARGTAGLPSFDLGIFDEAHKTTGPHGSSFAFGLFDSNLPLRKRLFFTATPRHIDIRHRDRLGDFRVVSMDDPEVYGPRAYTQTFGDAVAKGLICDYRVVVSVVDPAEIPTFALQHGITLIEGDQQATRWVAMQIAVSKAVRETGATRIITFHSRVSHAQIFASVPPRGIQQHLDGFIVDHVNGTQRVADRKAILAGFKDERKRLITNARCLTEGVDVPAVDMVVFSNPRKSRVDIVQAVGRAMRRPQRGAKTLGYVVVPLLLAPQDTADVAAACADTDWEDVIDVLAALREQDARLDDIIRAQQVAKGRGEIFSPRAFREQVQVLGPVVSLEVLEQHIGAVIVSWLGERWDDWYGRLLLYRDRFGHVNVPQSYADDPRLGRWCATQRQEYRHGWLSQSRTKALIDVGFAWNTLDWQWEQRFAELCAFKATSGHTRATVDNNASSGLIGWCREQRAAFRDGSLTAERLERLESIGFLLRPYGVAWEQRFQQLTEFWREHGHTRLPEHYPVRGLRSWCANQRTARTQGILPSDRLSRLEALGFEWEDGRWDEMYEHFVAFVRAHGHNIVPHTGESRLLAKWLAYQRRQVRKGALPPDRVKLLADFGVTFNPYELAWERRYAMLLSFFQRTGHSTVPDDEESVGTLASWCKNQRTLRSAGRLSANRISRLEAVQFVWNRLEASWNERYEELVAFGRTHGHVNVPSTKRSRSKLSLWCEVQRRFRKNRTLSPERIALLDALGFAWTFRKPVIKGTGTEVV